MKLCSRICPCSRRLCVHSCVESSSTQSELKPRSHSTPSLSHPQKTHTRPLSHTHNTIRLKQVLVLPVNQVQLSCSVLGLIPTQDRNFLISWRETVNCIKMSFQRNSTLRLWWMDEIVSVKDRPTFSRFLPTLSENDPLPRRIFWILYKWYWNSVFGDIWKFQCLGCVDHLIITVCPSYAIRSISTLCMIPIQTEVLGVIFLACWSVALHGSLKVTLNVLVLFLSES